MTFEDILNISKNMIDETDQDDQIDVILKSAINKSYLDLCKIDKRITTAFIPIINKVATLPDDLIGIEQITPSLTSKDKKIGNSIITSNTGTFDLLYSYLREPLVNNTDEPDLNLSLQYAMATYACYKYFEYRKKKDIAETFYQNYSAEVSEFIMNSDSVEEIVNDVYL